MANILAWPESEAPTVPAGGERTPASSEGANKEPQTMPPPLPPSVAVEESCNDARVLVDRSHSLPAHYIPRDLVSLPSYRIPTLGNGEMRLRSEAAERLRDLVSAATDGEELIVASAYRSYEDQETLWRGRSDMYRPFLGRIVTATSRSTEHPGARSSS